jgi:hypothetical protein
MESSLNAATTTAVSTTTTTTTTPTQIMIVRTRSRSKRPERLDFSGIVTPALDDGVDRLPPMEGGVEEDACPLSPSLLSGRFTGAPPPTPINNEGDEDDDATVHLVIDGGDEEDDAVATPLHPPPSPTDIFEELNEDTMEERPKENERRKVVPETPSPHRNPGTPYHDCVGLACTKAGHHFKPTPRDLSSLPRPEMEGAPRATAREVKLKRKMIVLDDDVSQLTPAEHAEILLLQAQKKVKSAIGMIKKSVDDTRCNNPLRRIHVVRGGAPIASTSTPPRSYARSAARDRNKAVMDFVDRHCSSLDMTLWGTDSAVGRMMSEAHEPPEMRRARQRAAAGCSIVDTQPPAEGMRRWMESAGEGRLPWNAHSHHRAALVAELCILCKFANVGQESVHLVMQILDRVVGVWDSLLPPHPDADRGGGGASQSQQTVRLRLYGGTHQRYGAGLEGEDGGLRSPSSRAAGEGGHSRLHVHLPREGDFLLQSSKNGPSWRDRLPSQPLLRDERAV